MQGDQPEGCNLFTVADGVREAERERRNHHRGAIVWLTGLPASGKSTLAVGLERALFDLGCQVFLLDGDNVRQGLSADLGFSRGDRAENIRRIGEVAALFAKAGTIIVTAFISPYRADRERIRARHAKYFHEIYLNAPVAVCEARDPKGLYKRARAGEVKDFTGISAPYEPPQAPELVIKTGIQSVAESRDVLVRYVKLHLLISNSAQAIG
jgi:bifunctional enzyme CysN/CysC